MKKLIFLFLLATTFGCAQTTDFKQLDNLLDILHNNDKFMGSMSILKDGDVVYNKAVGYADFNENEKQLLSTDTKFKIGSITKTFTATMIFQLVDEGKLSLDDTLDKFFPSVTNASIIKILNLLNHSSGLYNLTNAPQFGEWIHKPTTPKEMLSRINLFDANFEPGEKNEYSNTNYLLLGYIIEQIDRKTYAKTLQNRIVKTLNLKDTYYGGDINIESNECNSYTFEDGKWQISGETHMSLPGGAGAIVSKPSELVKFIDALFSGKLMSPESLKTMTTVGDSDFRHGIFYFNQAGIDIYGHDGGIDGFQSMLVYSPMTKTAIALTSNALNYSKKDIMLNAFAVSHGQPIQLPNFNQLTLSPEVIKSYEGIYECDEVEYDLVFEAHGSILKGAPEQSNLKDLAATAKNEFRFEPLNIIINFDLENQSLIFKRGDNEPLKFTRKL